PFGSRLLLWRRCSSFVLFFAACYVNILTSMATSVSYLFKTCFACSSIVCIRQAIPKCIGQPSFLGCSSVVGFFGRVIGLGWRRFRGVRVWVDTYWGSLLSFCC